LSWGLVAVVLFHVTNLKLLKKYLETRHIQPPARAWRSLDGALRFSKQTDRKIILRLTARKEWRELGGHQGQAMWTDQPYPMSEAEL
jgi:hypothetical protein